MVSLEEGLEGFMASAVVMVQEVQGWSSGLLVGTVGVGKWLVYGSGIQDQAPGGAAVREVTAPG